MKNKNIYSKLPEMCSGKILWRLLLQQFEFTVFVCYVIFAETKGEKKNVFNFVTRLL